MTRNQRTFSFVAILTAAVLVVMMMSGHFFAKNSKNIVCNDGAREWINPPDFARQYFTSSVALAVNIELNSKVIAKFNPTQRQQLSDSLETAGLFKRSFPGNYNSCTITREQFARDFARLRSLEDLAHRINQLVAVAALSPEEKEKLASLVGQFIDIQGKLGADYPR